VIIRPATPDDIQAITDLGLEALMNDAYPNLVIDKDKVKAMATECVSAATNFSWVTEVDGKIVAAVSAIVTDMMFYERKQANVVQFYTTVPNAGLPLIREFLRWSRNRRVIKLICFTLESNADPRIGKLLRSLGLKEELPVWMELR